MSERFLNLRFQQVAERVAGTLATMPGTSRLAAASPASDAFLKDQLASLEGGTPTKGTARELSGEPDSSALLQHARMARLRRRFVPWDAWGSVCHSVIRN